MPTYFPQSFSLFFRNICTTNVPTYLPISRSLENLNDICTTRDGLPSTVIAGSLQVLKQTSIVADR